jgi:hypothetical protein
VALSRATNPQGLRIVGGANRLASRIVIDEAVKRWL